MKHQVSKIKPQTNIDSSFYIFTFTSLLVNNSLMNNQTKARAKDCPWNNITYGTSQHGVDDPWQSCSTQYHINQQYSKVVLSAKQLHTAFAYFILYMMGFYTEKHD